MSPYKAVAGFVPYGDGNGYRVVVSIEQTYEDSPIEMSIDTLYRFSISEWPRIRAGIDRMLKTIPEN